MSAQEKNRGPKVEARWPEFPAFPLSRFPLFPASAFTLIEMVGVLAVLVISASLMLPAVIRRIDFATQAREAAELSGMATALQSYILRTGQIPDQNGLVSALASEMAVSSNQIALNSRNAARVFMVDPNLWVASSTGTLPYTQSLVPYGTGTTNANGFAVPGLSLRMMILSSLALPLPSPASIDFNNVWNTPDGYLPTSVGWSGWAGHVEDLKIQRMDFTSLFKRVILNPIDTNYFGSFAIESGQSLSATNVVAKVLTNSWYFQGSAVRLYDTNYNYFSPVMEMKAVIQSDTSFVFENQAWRNQLTGWGTNGPLPLSTSTADLFTILSANLSLAPFNTNSTGNFGDSTLAMLGDFYSFMANYNSWAQAGFVGVPTALTQATNAVNNITQDMSR